jgi:hypothetical protein
MGNAAFALVDTLQRPETSSHEWLHRTLGSPGYSHVF